MLSSPTLLCSVANLLGWHAAESVGACCSSLLASLRPTSVLLSLVVPGSVCCWSSLLIDAQWGLGSSLGASLSTVPCTTASTSQQTGDQLYRSPVHRHARQASEAPLLLQAVGPVAVTSLLLGTGLKNVVGKEVAIQADPNNPTSPADQAIYNQAAVQVGPFDKLHGSVIEVLGGESQLWL